MSKLDQDLVQKIKELGEPPKGKDGKIVFKYLYKFCDVVGNHTKLAEELAVEEMVNLRREAYKSKNDKKYEELVLAL